MIDLPTATQVLAYAGLPADEHTTALADEHTKQAALLVKSYTRGRGFSEDGQQCAEDVAAVVVSYAARSLSNPTAAKEIESGSFKASPGSPWSFSLIELLVLREYRRTAG